MSVASILTNQPQRDEHLRSADFFDAAQHPTITFASTRIEASDDGSLRITGNLTIHGVTHEVVLSDAMFVGDKVKLTLDISAIKQN